MIILTRHALAVVALLVSTAAWSLPPGPALAGVASHGHREGTLPRSASRALVPDRVELRTALADVLARGAVPAVAAAIVTSHGIVADVAGVRRLGEPARVRRSDLWHLGSCEKSMTATMIATLVERGALRWDTRVTDVLPEVLTTMRPEYRDVTLSHLLRHRAGVVPLESYDEYLALPTFPGAPRAQRIAFAEYAFAQPPAATPGIGYAYSNGGYAIAAAMAERVTGRSFTRLMRTRLFDPLRLDAKFDWPSAGDPAQPWGHYIENDAIVLLDADAAENRFPRLLDPAGNVSLSIEDFARYAQLHLRGLRGEGRLLQYATFRELHTPAFEPGDEFPYAAGWIETEVDGVATSFHDGSAGAAYAVMYVQPSRDRAVVVATNMAPEVSVEAVNALAARLLRHAR